jgi:hypothetical protein
MIWIPLAVAIVLVLALAAYFGRRRPATIVLGQEYAEAGAEEAKRLAAGAAGPSPMPAGDYDLERDDYSLVAVEVRPLDRELRRMVEGYRQAAPGTHAELRHRIDTDGCYTLIQFAKRCAALALREPAGSWCEDGLTALAMIDETRVDRRDPAWAAGLLQHAIAATGADRPALVDRVAALASPGMAAILGRSWEPDPLSAWGYAEIRTPDGPGLIATGGARYEPTLDLTGLALRVTAQLSRGRYTADPEIATDLPGLWFGSGQRQAEAVLKRARAGVAVRGSLRKGIVDEPSWQMLMVWIVEMPTAEDAAALLGCVRSERRRDERFTVGLASGCLFALFIAGSSAVGAASFENPKTLRALAEEMRPLLEEAGGAG